MVKVVSGLPAEWGMCSRTILPNSIPQVLACWNNTIAVGLRSGEIIFLNAITGSQRAVLSKHTKWVRSLTFSSDGTFLVSGSDDGAVILWDVQTGGIVKSFRGHTSYVLSVSISSDCTTIASGSRDQTIRLWDIQTGMYHCVINRHESVKSISFCPTNCQLLISASAVHTIEWWDTKGCQIRSTYEGDHVIFSLDGTYFISWRERVAIVQSSDSGAVVAELEVPSAKLKCCCFSPNGNLVIGGAGHTIYVWDITGSDPHLIETLVGHTDTITSLTFSSSLTSASKDGSVKFWQICALPTDPVATNVISTPLAPTRIQSTSLLARDGIAITSDEAGVIKTWDIKTGLCMASFQAPARGNTWRDAQLIEGRLVLAWWEDGRIHIWDAEKEELAQTMDTFFSVVNGIRISGDGSKVFCLHYKSILAWSVQTGESIGEVELEDNLDLDPLCVDGSKIWVCLRNLSLLQGWDFGTPGSSPTPLSNILLNRPRLDLVDGHKWWKISPNTVKDTVTGENVFQLSGRYGEPFEVRWDGRYLVAGYRSGKVLILDFNHMLPPLKRL